MTEDALRGRSAVIYARNSAGKDQSIAGQNAANRMACERHGWTVVAELADGVSASRYTRKIRDNWATLLGLVPQADVIVLWEASRGDRTLGTWIAFVDLCREHGVLIHATGHSTTYDPRQPRQYRSLAEDGVDAAYESDKTSDRLLRGFAAAARLGRPHSHTLYGYERIYDSRSGALVEQREHPKHGPIAREIVRRVGRGEPCLVIAKDLDSRGIPPPGKRTEWDPVTIRRLSIHRGYLGIRVHRTKTGEITEHPALWPAIVTDAEHYAAVRVISDPARRTTKRPRDGRATSLLGNIVICARCGKTMTPHTRRGHWIYSCCVTVRHADLDNLITALVIGRLSDPDVYAKLRHHGDADDKTAVEARRDADRLRAELSAWRESAAKGETTPASLRVVEAGLTARIEAADRRAVQASVSPVLRGMLGPIEDVEARWDEAPLPVKRDVVRTLLTVTVYSSRLRGPGLHERVEITWKGAT